MAEGISPFIVERPQDASRAKSRGAAGVGEGPRGAAAHKHLDLLRARLVLLLPGLAACASSGALAPSLHLTPIEESRVEGRAPLPLVTQQSPESAVLRRRADEVPPARPLPALAAAMERTMRASDGVGIAGPQVGLRLRVAVLLLGYRGKSPHAVFVRNPFILERSDETVSSYEGCLSVPGKGGLVRRNLWVRVRYLNEAGRHVETRAEGPDAILWQHELDHLDGVLYVDRLIGELMSQGEMRRRRKELEHGTPATRPSADRPSGR